MKEIADMAEQRALAEQCALAEQSALSEYDGEPLDELGWLPCTDSQVLEQLEVIAPGLAA